jgi:hypothetical protein
VKTDSLIEALAREVPPARPKPNWLRLAASGLVGALAAAGLAALFFGVRPDANASMDAVLMKSLYSLAIAVAAAPLALLLAQPNTGLGRKAWPAWAAIVLSLIFAGVTLLMTPPSNRLAAWFVGEFPKCLMRLPILAAPIMVALMLAARRLAPTRLALAGAALGGLAGAVAAIVYAWVCMADSAAYVATWYLASILLCAAAGALLGRWLLRW